MMVRCIHGRIARLALCGIAIVVAAFAGTPAMASVVVIANRTQETLRLDAAIDGGAPAMVELGPGDSRPLFATKSVVVRVVNNGAVRQYPLQPDSAYYVGMDAATGVPVLQQIGLGETGPRAWPAMDRKPLEFPGAETVPVKILVDDDEPRQRTTWEPVLRARVEAASKILQAHCGIGLRVVAVGTWDSDDSEKDFFRSLSEFEREVQPAPARLAIGFSSQYEVNRGRFHLGGTRGPLSTHVLVKERASSVLEPERLEVLTHELGHFLGASHSPEATSVMRPVIGQGLQRHAGAHVQFDPVNTLLMSLVGQELRQRRIADMTQATPETRRRMAEIYAALEATLPDDPAAEQYLQLMSLAGSATLVNDTRLILGQITRMAKVQQRLREQQTTNLFEPSGNGGKADHAATDPLRDDALCEFYVRQAAVLASQKQGPHVTRSLILAIGLGLDDKDIVSRATGAGDIVPRIEGVSQRAERARALGKPTMQNDAELRRQFFASACIVAMSGSQTARSAETVRELLGAGPAGNLDFARLVANRAGLVFAHAVLGSRLPPTTLARDFRVADVLPPTDEIARQIGAEEFQKAGVGFNDLPSVLQRLEAQLSTLPAYQPK